jgi:hypothetical protein
MPQNPATFSGTPYGPLAEIGNTIPQGRLALAPNAIIPYGVLAMPDSGNYLHMTRGDGFPIPIDVWIGVDSYVLTAHDIWATFKSDLLLTDAQAEIQKTLGAGIAVSTNVDTQVDQRLTITLVEADTNQLPNVDTYLHMDVQIKQPGSDDPWTIYRGILEIRSEVTLSS